MANSKKNNHQRRLQSARTWINSYNGKNIVKGYRKKYGVDWNCAFTELETLGIKIDPNYKEEVLKSVKKNAEIKRQKKLEKEFESAGLKDMNMDFYYITGYTSNGFPYGVTWEESGLSDEEIKYYKNLLCKSNELNFK